MPYSLSTDDRTLGDALRRIAHRQIGEALDAIRKDDPAKAVHEVRRRAKTLRGLIRLFRTGFDEFADADDAIRAIARPLSATRDAKVMLDTADMLAAKAEGHAARHMFKHIHRRLDAERKEKRDGERVDDLLHAARERLKHLEDRAEIWTVEGEGWNVPGEGAAITYGHMLKNGARALSGHRPEDFHELRKHVRYHWCHARLLRPLWPEEMDARALVADELAHGLGQHHDLAVFTGWIGREAIHLGPADDLAPVLALAAQESSALEDRARELCGRLLAETEASFIRRWHALWRNWESASG
ncbi:MAG TPA: CHAD domain-containing protein [Sphingomonadaceae bacterium]|nr:CHAD domain-containing protein [Sphingomonadaceae bacterium]